MKKLFSSILALAMSMSMFAFTAQAASEAKYEVTYEAINVASGDVNKLAVGDTFYAVVTLKGATGIFGGGMSFTWDADKLTTINAAGNANKVFNTVSTSRITTTLKTTGMNEDTGEMEQVAAFKQPTAKITDGKAEYEYAAESILDENGEADFYDYPVDGDVVVYKLRFKVLKAEDPNFNVIQSQLRESKATTLDNIDTTLATLGFGSSEPETAPEYFNANFTAGGPKYNGNKGMEFFFKSAKLNKEASYIFNFDEMFKDPTFESETNVDVAIKVNDVPEDDTVTLTGYEWSELGR